jgi:hypothetical protein
MIIAVTEFLSLFKYWRMWLILGLITLIFGGAGYIWWDISHLKSQLKVDQVNIRNLLAANVEQKSALAQCTANTEQLKTDSDNLAKKAQESQAMAHQKAQSHTDAARRILEAKPSTGQSDYEDTQGLINSFIIDGGQ